MNRRRLNAAVLTCVAAAGCFADAPATRPTIASTVPSATDLIVGMGAADQLVAVSTYDAGRPDVGRRPKAGDYQTIDWEQVTKLRPSTLVTFVSADRQPAGVRDRAAKLHIKLLNVPIDRLTDLDPAIDSLGTALDRPDLAAAAKQHLKDQLDAVTRRVKGQPPVSALIVLSPDATAVAGSDTFLDDVLQKAGGTNAAARLHQNWPRIDREMLLSLKPDVVIQLVPGGKPQEVAQAKATWARFRSVPAVAHDRVCILTDPYVEQPGWHLPDLAERMAECLHPAPQ